MGNTSSNLKEQSALSVSQPKLVATTSQLLLTAHEQRPRSDTDLFRKSPTVPAPRTPLLVATKAKQSERDSTDNSKIAVRRSSSIMRRSGYKTRSASLRRQRSILRRNGNLKGKSRSHVRRTIEVETELKMAQEQKELFLFAARGDLEHVEALVDSGVDVNSADENQLTALHHAAMHSRDKVIASLVERGADLNATDLKGGFNALHWVVINADPQTSNTDHVSNSLKALINAGCKVNGTDFNFATPLHIAAQKGNKTSIETLVRLGADPDKVDITGRNCYDIAKNQEIRDFVRHLTTPDRHVYHILEVQPDQRPRSMGPVAQSHDYHVLEGPVPPRSSSCTPPPPPPRRRRTQHSQFIDTHIYHVLEIPTPAATNKTASPPRRRKTITRK